MMMEGEMPRGTEKGEAGGKMYTAIFYRRKLEHFMLYVAAPMMKIFYGDIIILNCKLIVVLFTRTKKKVDA